MIRSYKNKNLEKLMMRGVGVRLQQKHVPQLRRILTSLNDLRHPSDVRKIFGTQGHYLSVYKGTLLSCKPMVTSLMLTTGIITRHF